MNLPDIALSVRQPWAWAIIHAGKDIENRSRFAVSKGLTAPKHIAVHAAKGLTRAEYEDSRDFMAKIGVICPPPSELRRGGIIGSIYVSSVVSKSASQWFFGPKGLVLSDPRACDFLPAVGALGYFRWQPSDASNVPTPARWMTPPAALFEEA